MDIRQLRHFLAILDYQSFSRAAEHLGKSQQALSKSVQGLEDALGVRLLDRTSRISKPTVYGELLAECARGIDRIESNFRQQLAAMREVGTERVRIGASPTAAPLVGEALLRVTKANPTLRFDVLTGVYWTMSRDLLAGGLDLFVCIDNEDFIDPALTKSVLMLDDYRVVASAEHPLAASKDCTAEDLARYPWILGRTLGEIERAWRNEFEKADLLAPDPPFETSSVEVTKYMVISSQLLTILPSQMVEFEVERGVLCLIEAPKFIWGRPLAMHHRQGGVLSAGLVATIEALRSAAIRLK